MQQLSESDSQELLKKYSLVLALFINDFFLPSTSFSFFNFIACDVGVNALAFVPRPFAMADLQVGVAAADKPH